MVHREARHAVDAMRGERRVLVVAAVCGVGGGMWSGARGACEWELDGETRSSAENWSDQDLHRDRGVEVAVVMGDSYGSSHSYAGSASSHGACISGSSREVAGLARLEG